MRLHLEVRVFDDERNEIGCRFGTVGCNDVVHQFDDLAYNLKRIAREVAFDVALRKGFGGDGKAFGAWARSKSPA